MQTVLAAGEFTVQLVGPDAAAAAASGASVDPQQLRVEAAVSSKQARVAFPLGKHLPALKAAGTIYSFALEHVRTEYYILILPAGARCMLVLVEAIAAGALMHGCADAGCFCMGLHACSLRRLACSWHVLPA